MASTSADVYRSLLEPSTDSEQLNTVLTGVAKLEATPLYPAILSTLEKHNESTAHKVAEALVSYYVRWTVIGRRESTELEKQVFGLAKEIYEGLSIAKALSSIKEISPTDTEFETDFKSASLTKAGQRRPILVALENYMREVADADEVVPKSALVLHVEHLYPQNPKKEEHARLKDHDEWVHRVGNLTLLAGKWNTGIKNGDFQSVKGKRTDQLGSRTNRNSSAAVGRNCAACMDFPVGVSYRLKLHRLSTYLLAASGRASA
jgi:Protein of unknown function (DUF1524)